MEQIIPMMSCYSTYVRDHVHAIEIFFDISRDNNFKQFLEHLHSKPDTKGLTLTELLAAPLHKVNGSPMYCTCRSSCRLNRITIAE